MKSLSFAVGMISLSNVLKHTKYRERDGAFRIQLREHTLRVEEGQDPQDEPTLTAEEDVDRLAEEAKRHAEEVLRDAAREAERLKREAKAEIEKWWSAQRGQDRHIKEDIRKTAYDEGYTEGYEKGLAEAKRQLEEELDKARDIVKSSYIAKQQVIREAEPFLVQLSVDIAEKVIARQVELDETVIVDMVQRALDHCNATGSITVFVKPERFPLVQGAREELKRYVNGNQELKIVPDRMIESDGCIIRSQQGSVDARVDVQLNQIRKTLMEVAKEDGESRDAANLKISAKIEAVESAAR